MLKKIGTCLLVGSIALTAAACGNTGDKKEEASTVQINEKKSTSGAQDTSYKTIFKNSVFLGDSIVERLKSGDFLDGKNVMAELGLTTIKALNQVDEIATRKPEHIFISMGIDDLTRCADGADGKEKPAEPVKYVTSNYSNLLKKIKEKLPNAKIHVLSVTPVSEQALKIGPQYKAIDNLNASLKDLTNTEKIDFVDLSPIFKKHKVPYVDPETDGVHFKDEYYPLLLEYLKDKIK
ncbi:hypothetical protein IIU_05898 [Bacillus cereus VD133]|uniref:SGNH hydrolase-type esterase domain-containing protein n=2 Tax=Bacillus cereus TaxID=1396 RepID=A0A9W5UZV3_BACCE|nr:hypothetical protein IIU_05898 [Bacillus cereus VD133]